MNRPRRRRTVYSVAALAGALLWGVVELVALARSRWSMRHERGLSSGAHRG